MLCRSFRYLVISSFLLLATIGCGQQEVQIYKITNSDVVWHTGYVGIEPELRGESRRAFESLPNHELPLLIDKLGLESSFVAVHVILSLRSGLPRTSADSSEWNGLDVVIRSDSTYDYSATDRAKLVAKWKAILTAPRSEP